MKHLHKLLLLSSVLLLSGCTSKTVSPGATVATPAAEQKNYTMAEVAPHNNQNDCWLVIDKNVYNVTTFIPDHPGGEQILKGCGKDATSLFQGERKHQGPDAQDLLPQFKIGQVQQ